jgi:hypothetical protein
MKKMDTTFDTNVQNFYLEQSVGIVNSWKSFNFFYCFMVSQKEEDYDFIFKSLKELLGNNFAPDIIATDRELALINSIKKNFPVCRHLLCLCLL